MLTVTLTPDRPAYYPGDTLRVRIRFARGQGRENPVREEPRQRRGVVGVGVGVGEGTGRQEGSEEAAREETPTRVSAPIPRHHPHARKVSVAQLPTPASTPIESTARPSSSSLEPIPEGPGDAASASASASADYTLITLAAIHPHATFTPSPAYIPPEPLIPLRSLLTHQPIGSGAWTPSAAASASASSHIIDRAAGERGLTGSLTSLARGLVIGNSGTWDERRREVWMGKGLAVWEGGREVVGVDVRVDEAEAVEYIYQVPIPSLLPPTFKGKALSFAYTVRLFLTVALPPRGNSQRASSSASSWGLWRRGQGSHDPPGGGRTLERELSVPIRVLARVAVPPTTETYDLLRPIIARTSDASVRRLGDPVPTRRQQKRTEQTCGAWIKARVEEVRREREGAGGGEAEMVERITGREAVRALVQSSRPGQFEIVKRHHEIAVLELPRTAWRTGEQVHGHVRFHRRRARFDVLKVAIDLVTTETIPPPLLPTTGATGTAPSATDPGPLLRRTIATYGNAYTTDLASLGFSLGIPRSATAAFEVGFGNAADGQGGLAWALHVKFLVTVRRREGVQREEIPAGRVHDDVSWERSGMTGQLVRRGQAKESELDVDIVECMIPLTVLPHDEGKAEPSLFQVLT